MFVVGKCSSRICTYFRIPSLRDVLMDYICLDVWVAFTYKLCCYTWSDIQQWGKRWRRGHEERNFRHIRCCSLLNSWHDIYCLYSCYYELWCLFDGLQLNSKDTCILDGFQLLTIWELKLNLASRTVTYFTEHICMKIEQIHSHPMFICWGNTLNALTV